MNSFFKTPVLPVPTRRQALGIGATLAGGALLIGCSPNALGKMMSLGAKHDFDAFGPFIKVAADGTVTVVSKHIEFGQGNHAGLAAIAAEEMDADWDKLKVEQAPANAGAYANLGMGVQGTGGSSAISNSWMQLRNAGAAARAMFVQAAATTWACRPRTSRSRTAWSVTWPAASRPTSASWWRPPPRSRRRRSRP